MTGRIKREVQTSKLPIIGKIKVGERDEKTGYPRSLDYFKADGEYSAYFNEVFGEKPTSITVMFVSDILQDSCYERYELRQGSKLYADGDGENFRVWDEKAKLYRTFSRKDHPDIMERVVAKAKEGESDQKSRDRVKWDIILTLTFVIPDIRGVFGAWRFSTKGDESSIPQIVSAFDQVRDMAGTIVKIPFDLQVEKVVSQKPGSKNAFPVVKLIPNISSQNLEKVKMLLDANVKISGLLTEDKIEAESSRIMQISHDPEKKDSLFE